ncbi:synaptonemal complex protein 1-like [Exaiptasia diaphana]|uniref:Uncharacterized protein n=1 Tax=Exaiptasia diaphana TaxID=2652724 RepID=A0A913XVJ7_EXADI|nr:synaptonemal complex protein 1-like [Exaiptasia diaphana]
MSIEELNEKIASLDLRIERLENDKRTLVTTLRQKDEFFTEEIKGLVPKTVFEEKKKELEYEIAALRNDKAILSSEVESLKAEGRKDKESIRQFIEHRVSFFQQIQGQLEKKETDSKREMESLRKEMDTKIKKLSDNVDAYKREVKVYKSKTDDLQKSRDVLYIGQLFAKCMVNIYQEILPAYFKDKDGKHKKEYQVPHPSKIEKNIETLYQTKEEQDEKKAIWRKKKEEIGSDYFELMAEVNPSQLKEICREILPDLFLGKDGKPEKEFKQLCLKNIEKEIELTYKSKKKQDEKKEIWRAKKEEIGSDFVKFMEKTMNKRNHEAHPNLLKEEDLQKIGETMSAKERSFLELAMKLVPAEYLGKYKYFWVGTFTE